MIWRRLGIIILLIIIFIRPNMDFEKVNRATINLNIWFVVDATGSMIAKDADAGATRRYEKVQSDVASIVKAVPGAKYGIIMQDFANYNVLPLTYNADAAIAAKTYLSPKWSGYAQPTNLSELIDYSLERISDYSKANPERKNAIILMSDGEDFTDSAITRLKDIPLIDAAFVLGYGSIEGSLIETVNSLHLLEEEGLASQSFYVRYIGNDYRVTVDSDHNVISKLDEKNLLSIARTLGGEYYNRRSGEVPTEVTDSLKEISTVTNEKQESNASTKGEIYYLFALVLLALLLWEGEELLISILLEKEDKHA